MAEPLLLVAAGLIRRADDVLLVQQQGPGDGSPRWALPGGVALPGELLAEALRREVREETGLEVLDAGPLLYLAQVQRPGGAHTLAAVFAVAGWRGEIACADPDRLVSTAAFVPWAEAERRLAALPWRSLGEPIAAYLRGKARPGAVWGYRETAGGVLQLMERSAGAALA